MALTKCFECGHEVSTTAAACPNCGAPLGGASPPPPSPQSAPSPPPPILGNGQSRAESHGVFHRSKTYFIKLSRVAQTGWIFLLIGILFTAAFEPAFWGIIIGLILGIVLLFRKQRKDGLILGAAAVLTLIIVFSLYTPRSVPSPRGKQFTANQKLVNDLTLSFRKSLFDDGTQVLQIHNPNPHSIDFYLKCQAKNGSAKTLFVSVPALGMKEIGLFEGWQFETGERFEAVCDDEVVWHSEVK